MNNPGHFFFGLLWTGITIFAMYGILSGTVEEIGTIDDSIPVANIKELRDAGEDRLVSFEATIASENKRITKGFVIACEQFYEDSGESSSWETDSVLAQPLRLQLPDGSLTGEFKADECPRGDTSTHNVHSEHRWIGVNPGDRLHVVGGVTNASSTPRVDVLYYYAGTAKKHRSKVASSRNWSIVFTGIFSAIGIGIMLTGLIRL